MWIAFIDDVLYLTGTFVLCCVIFIRQPQKKLDRDVKEQTHIYTTSPQALSLIINWQY